MIEHRGRTEREGGFSLVELVWASLLALVAVGGVVGLVDPAGHVANAQPDAVDMQQRARMGAAALYRDLHVAGAGFDRSVNAGPLIGYLPPVLPRRIGALDPDPADAARSDAFSVVWVPETHAQTVLAAPLSGTTIAVVEGTGCPPGSSACGFESGMGAILFDRSGHFDLFTVLSVDGTNASLRHRGPASSHDYGAGTAAGEIMARTYYLDRAAHQLRVYDADTTDTPLLDDVVDLQVEYFGTTAPPVWPKPPPGEANCLYDTAGQRLSGGSVLPSGPGGQAELPLPVFTDGPWCGEGATRFDADLLRIRRVRITLGVQAASAARRGSGQGFRSSGTSRHALEQLPDTFVTFDVSPRNMNLLD